MVNQVKSQVQQEVITYVITNSTIPVPNSGIPPFVWPKRREVKETAEEMAARMRKWTGMPEPHKVAGELFEKVSRPTADAFTSGFGRKTINLSNIAQSKQDEISDLAVKNFIDNITIDFHSSYIH